MDGSKIVIKSLLMNEYSPPFSLKEFHDHCKKFKCEELVEYVISIYRYQSDYEANNVILAADKVCEVPPGEIISDRRSHKSFSQKVMQFIVPLKKPDRKSLIREPVEIDSGMNVDPSKPNSQLVKRRSELGTTEEKLLYIMNTYIKETAPKQINIPFIISRNLIKNYEKNIRGPHLFSDCLQHCEMILKTSALPSFLSERTNNPVRYRSF